eukprot:Awhi_evm1s9675
MISNTPIRELVDSLHVFISSTATLKDSTLAVAGPCVTFNDVPRVGIVVVNGNIEKEQSEKAWESHCLHELFHVLGFATSKKFRSLVARDEKSLRKVFTGENAQREYQAAQGAFTFPFLHESGHWSEREFNTE